MARAGQFGPAAVSRLQGSNRGSQSPSQQPRAFLSHAGPGCHPGLPGRREVRTGISSLFTPQEQRWLKYKGVAWISYCGSHSRWMLHCRPALVFCQSCAAQRESSRRCVAAVGCPARRRLLLVRSKHPV